MNEGSSKIMRSILSIYIKIGAMGGQYIAENIEIQ